MSKLGIGLVASILVAGAAIVVAVVAPTAAQAFPTAATTGVPSSVTLTAYTGTTTLTTCQTLNGVQVGTPTNPVGLTIAATNGTTTGATPCVTIVNSRVYGPIHDSYSASSACGAKTCGPVNITDSEVSADFANDALIEETNLNLLRDNVHGGSTNVLCDGWCTVTDSYIHDNYFVSPRHLNGFMSNGNAGRPIVLTHNTFLCDIQANSPSKGNPDGGCSGDLTFFGDFGQIANITVTNNQFLTSPDSSYCVYTGGTQPSKANPTAKNLDYEDNVWQRGSNNKCATYGPVADWAVGNGNVSCNNRWDDGATALADTPGCGSTPPSTSGSTTTLPPPPVTTTFPVTTTTKATTTTTTRPPTTTTTRPPVTTTTVAPPPPTTTTTIPTIPGFPLHITCTSPTDCKVTTG